MDNLSKLNLPAEDERAWMSIIKRWKAGGRITKAEVMRLLESGRPIPAQAGEFMAAALDGGDVFGRGNTKMYRISPRFAGELIARIESLIRNPSTVPDHFTLEDRQHYVKLHRRCFHNNIVARINRTTPRKEAKKIAAMQLDVSERHIQTLLNAYNAATRKSKQ